VGHFWGIGGLYPSEPPGKPQETPRKAPGKPLYR